MREFWILFKHEFKMQFPLRPQKGRFDFIGSLLSLLTTVLVAAVFVLLVSTIAENYVAVEIDKVAAPLARGKELLNLFYRHSFINSHCRHSPSKLMGVTLFYPH